MNGKWIYLAQRNPRFSREQFRARWLKHRTGLGAPPAMGAEFVTADYAAVRGDPPPGASDEYDAVGLFSLRGLSSIPTVAGAGGRSRMSAISCRADSNSSWFLIITDLA